MPGGFLRDSLGNLGGILCRFLGDSFCDVIDGPHGIYLRAKNGMGLGLALIVCNVLQKNLFLRHSVPNILTIGRQLLKYYCPKYSFGSKLLCLCNVCRCKMSRHTFRRLKALSGPLRLEAHH